MTLSFAWWAVILVGVLLLEVALRRIDDRRDARGSALDLSGSRRRWAHRYDAECVPSAPAGEAKRTTPYDWQQDGAA